MKTLRNTLVSLALALSGCDYEGETKLDSETISGFPVDVDGEYGKADIWISRYAYRITCDYRHFFSHEKAEDILLWGDVVYYDEHQDGDVDVINVNGERIYVNVNGINNRYQEILAGLKKDYVQRYWEDNWKNKP